MGSVNVDIKMGLAGGTNAAKSMPQAARLLGLSTETAAKIAASLAVPAAGSRATPGEQGAGSREQAHAPAGKPPAAASTAASAAAAAAAAAATAACSEEEEEEIFDPKTGKCELGIHRDECEMGTYGSEIIECRVKVYWAGDEVSDHHPTALT